MVFSATWAYRFAETSEHRAAVLAVAFEVVRQDEQRSRLQPCQRILTASVG